LINQHGVDFGTGYALEFAGEAIENMTMDERMTICNMAIEAGAKYGMMKPDETTFEYVKGREYQPENFEEKVEEWKELYSDEDATYDKIINVDRSEERRVGKEYRTWWVT